MIDSSFVVRRIASKPIIGKGIYPRPLETDSTRASFPSIQQREGRLFDEKVEDKIAFLRTPPSFHNASLFSTTLWQRGLAASLSLSPLFSTAFRFVHTRRVIDERAFEKEEEEEKSRARADSEIAINYERRSCSSN